jgi:hypothetical protein
VEGLKYLGFIGGWGTTRNWLAGYIGIGFSREEGETQGESVEVALKLLAKGNDVPTAADISGLSEEVVAT